MTDATSLKRREGTSILTKLATMALATKVGYEVVREWGFDLVLGQW